MEFEYVKTRINGNQMQTYIGQNVIVLGQLINMEPNGRNLKIKCCDDQIILVQLKQPVQNIIENGTFLEIEGKVSSRNAIACSKYTLFPSQLSENVDRKLYCDMVNLLLSPVAKNNFLIDDVSEHHGSGDTVEIIYNEGDSIKQESMDFQEASFLAM